MSADRLWAMEFLHRSVSAVWQASEIGCHLGTMAEQMERWKIGVMHANPNALYRLRNTRTGQIVFLRGAAP